MCARSIHPRIVVLGASHGIHSIQATVSRGQVEEVNQPVFDHVDQVVVVDAPCAVAADTAFAGGVASQEMDIVRNTNETSMSSWMLFLRDLTSIESAILAMADFQGLALLIAERINDLATPLLQPLAPHHPCHCHLHVDVLSHVFVWRRQAVIPCRDHESGIHQIPSYSSSHSFPRDSVHNGMPFSSPLRPPY